MGKGLEGREEVLLYVQGHMNTLLVLIMEGSSCATRDTINKLVRGVGRVVGKREGDREGWVGGASLGTDLIKLFYALPPQDRNGRPTRLVVSPRHSILTLG